MQISNELLPPLIRALLEPRCYPHPVDQVELIDTHISYVLLAGEYAYKIKKPVDLGFLDFSTPDKRRYFCEEEVRLNSRLAPGIYLKVVAIGGTEQAPTLGGEYGFEFAVCMRRFPQTAQLDRILAAGELQAGMVDAFARLIADFHDRAEAAAMDSPYGEEVTVYKPVEENFQALRIALTTPEFVARLDKLEAWSMTRFLRHRDLLAVRKRVGRVRECHGDLHLRNLAWVDGQPLAFDCIEFAPELRWIDVLNEVAFLTMDLQARNQPAMAARFLNRYLERSGDYEGLPLLPFYQTYRAVVRAKVDAIRLGQADVTEAERREIEAECRRYLELADNYSVAGLPYLLMTRGPSGSGKTTLSETLAERLGAIRLRSDVERKRLFGLRAEQSAQDAVDQGLYTAEAGTATYARLLELSARLLKAGYPVIVDAVFAHEAQRRPFWSLAAERGVPCRIIEFRASPAALRARLAARGTDASDAHLGVLEHQLAQWQPVTPTEQRALRVIDTEQSLDMDDFAAELSRALAAV